MAFGHIWGPFGPPVRAITNTYILLDKSNVMVVEIYSYHYCKGFVQKFVCICYSPAGGPKGPHMWPKATSPPQELEKRARRALNF